MLNTFECVEGKEESVFAQHFTPSGHRVCILLVANLRLHFILAIIGLSLG